MNSQAALAFWAFFGIAHVQPPDIVTLPLPSPFCVGMYAFPRVACHSGHGAAPLASQLFDNQLPSRSMASFCCGSSSWETVLAQVGASACCGVGPRPWSPDLLVGGQCIGERLGVDHPLLTLLVEKVPVGMP